MEMFTTLAVVLGLAAAGGIIARLARQPVILGYIAAGMVISVWGWKWPQTGALVEVLGQVGVTLLLFLAGMELPIPELKKLGRVAVVTGLGQIVVSAGLAFGLARLLGWGNQTAIYLGLGLSFGSTILMVKLLSERGDLQSLPGKIAVGYLLVQDFVAVGVLAMLSGVLGGNFGLLSLGWVAVKAVILVTAALFISGKVVGRVMNYVNQSTELLFIVAMGWCLVTAAVVASPGVGFSVEIGGFLAGLSLASAVESAQIVARVRPVRDFFLTWFFVALGARVHLAGAGNLLVPAVLLAAFVTVVNPVVVMLFLGAFRYKKRVAFMASLATISVSEFSLIVAANAVRIGAVPDSLLTVLTMVALITMTGETYILGHAQRIYKKLSSGLKFVEIRKSADIQSSGEELNDHIVLFGHNRIGRVVRPVLEKLGTVVVVDFNPEVVERLGGLGIKVIYGDMSDHEMYEELGLKEAKLVVSTVPDINDSLRFLGEMKGWRRRPSVILTAVDEEEAGKLYKAGADYVLVPHSVGGEYVAGMLSGVKEKLEERVSELGRLHLKKLNRG